MSRPRFLMIPLDLKSNKSIMEEVKDNIIYDNWIKPHSVERYLLFDKEWFVDEYGDLEQYGRKMNANTIFLYMIQYMYNEYNAKCCSFETNKFDKYGPQYSRAFVSDDWVYFYTLNIVKRKHSKDYKEFGEKYYTMNIYKFDKKVLFKLAENSKKYSLIIRQEASGAKFYTIKNKTI